MALAIIYWGITIVFELLIKLIMFKMHIPDTYKPKKKHSVRVLKKKETELTGVPDIAGSKLIKKEGAAT